MSRTTIFWLLSGAAILLVVCVAAFRMNDWIENKIREAVEEKIKAPNQISFEGIDVSILAGSASFQEVTVQWLLKKPGLKADVTAADVNLEDIDWINFLLSKKLNIGNIHINSPFVTITRLGFRDTLSQQPQSDIAGLKCLDIGNISLKHGRFKVLKDGSDQKAEMEADTFNVKVGGFSLLFEEKDQPMKLAKAEVEICNFLLRSADNFNEISLKHLKLNNKDSLIEVKHFRVKPLYSKREFISRLKYKRSWIDLNFPELTVTGWHFDELMKGNWVARKVSVNNMDLQVFTDRKLPPDPNDYKPYPHELLLKASMGITIDTVQVSDGKLIYENLGADRSKPGKLVFSPLEGTLSNITNNKDRIEKNSVLEVKVQAKIQQKYTLKQHFWLNLASPLYAFTFTGSASGIPFQSLNSILTPTSNVVFERGMIKSLDYRINADDKKAGGQLTLQYEDLDFSLLNEQKEKRKFLSELVDLLFVDEENYYGEKNFRKGEVHAIRDSRRSFFNFWWNAVQSGLISSVFTQKTIQKMQKAAAKKKRKR